MAEWCERVVSAKWERKGDVLRLISYGIEHIVVYLPNDRDHQRALPNGE